MYNLIEYSDNYLKASGILWQYYGDERFMKNNGVIIDVPDDPDNASFKSKQKITFQTGNDGSKDVEIMVPLKSLCNFWKTLEMPLINCEINNFLTWLEKCFIVTRTADDQEPIFAITDVKLYVPLVTSSAADNAKLLQQLKTGFKEQLTGININQNQRYRHETDI